MRTKKQKMNCKNCNQSVDGKFCANCGQSISVDKINLANFLRELSESIFQVNKGFFYTLKVLFIKPGHSIREYLYGKRKSHFKPIAYAFTLSTIYFLLAKFIGSETFINDSISGWATYSNEADLSKTEAKQLAVFGWFAKNYAYTILLLLPVYSLASYLAFFKSGFNYLEHFVLNAYIIGQQAILYSLSAILSIITNQADFLATVSLFISILYAFFVFSQFFSKLNRVSIILRSMLTYLLYLIMILLVFFIVFAVMQLL